MRPFLSGLIVALILLPGPPAGGVPCVADVVPAATLLVPQFLVGLSPCGGGINTLVKVTNVLPEAVLVHVTFWTDLAVPGLDFDVYLTGYDVETLDLVDIFCNGNVPSTGSAASNYGPLSGDPVLYSSCNNTTVVGDPPLYSNPVISSVFRSHLKAFFSGLESPVTGDCAASGADRGFLTIDVVNNCSLNFPNETFYWTFGIPADTNALLGEVIYTMPLVGVVSAFPAVHVEADPAFDDPTTTPTFYGAITSSIAGISDRREPLPSVSSARFMGEAGTSTRFLVWRGRLASDSFSFPCGSSPALHPAADVVFFDEEENAVTAPVPLTERINDFDVTGSVLNPFGSGWALLDLTDGTLTAAESQGWVTVLYSSSSTPSAALQAVPVTALCSP